MAINDPVETTRENIISMVLCRHDYGHANQITDDFFWSLLGKTLTDAEYANSFDPLAGYTTDDMENAIENLTGWRDDRAGPDPNMKE